MTVRAQVQVSATRLARKRDVEGLITALSLPAGRAPQDATEAAKIRYAAGIALADFDEPRVVRGARRAR
jgi:hypothetical protein